MDDRQNTLVQLGTFQLVGAVVLAGLLFGLNRAVTVMDGHGETHARVLQEKLDTQTALLRELNVEVRQLKSERRALDELKEALRSGLAEQRAAAPQVVYAMPAAGAPAAPVQAAPTQPQAAPTPPQAAPAQPPAASTQPERPAEPKPGEGTAHADDLGTSKKVPGPDPKAIVGGTFTEAMSEPSTLNYYTTSEGATRQVMMNVLETLFTVSEKDPTVIDPMLAASWEQKDELTYVYNLRRGVTWSDGAPFTADDVLFSYAVIQDPAVKSEAHKGAYIDVESVTKLDDFTVQVRFKRPYWKSLYVFGNSLWIIPKHWFERRIPELAKEKGIEVFSTVPGQDGFGRVFNMIQEPCVGTGPYSVVPGGWIPGVSLTLERNPNYWRLQVEPGIWNIKTRKVRFISDHLAQINQVRQQKIDVQVVKLDEYQDSLSKEKVITDNYDYHSYDHLGLGFNYIVWNCRQFPFDDARVRTAMTHLVDREGMLRDLWRNDGKIATCPNKPIYPEYNQALVAHPFDPERAAELLAEAGFVDHDGDGVLEKQVDGQWKRFEFVLKVPSGIVEYERIGSIVRQALEPLGVKMEIRPIEWSVFIEHLYALNFEAMCLYSSFSDPWIDNYEGVHSSEDKPRGGNLPGLRLPELDELATKARTVFDRAERVKLYHRIYEILHEQQPMTLLIHGRVHVLCHKRFQNVVVRHKGMRSTYWWVDPTWRMPE